MQPSDIIAHACLAHMISPLLAQFLHLARNQTNAWANQLIAHLVSVVGEQVPETWSINIDRYSAPAVTGLMSQGWSIALDHLGQDPGNRDIKLDLVPLMLLRDNTPLLLPDATLQIKHQDHILFCGRPSARSALAELLNNPRTLTYSINGEVMPDSYLWRWLNRKMKKKNE